MVVVLGSLNLDLAVDVLAFPRPGETVIGANLRRSPGGKGANQAVAIARMGLPVALAGAVGDDPFGLEMVAGLAAYGIDVTGIRQQAGCPTGSALILIEESGQNQIVVIPGANGTLTRDDVTLGGLRLDQARALVVQLEIPLPAVVGAIQTANVSSVPVFLNAAPAREIPNEILAAVDWILVNQTEAAVLAGTGADSDGDPAELARRIRHRSDGACVAITLGTQGVWIACDEFTGHIPGFTVPVVDTVGAGDAFVGAFVARLVSGDPAYDAAVVANAAGALAVTRPGAQAGMPSALEVIEFLRSCPGQWDTSITINPQRTERRRTP